LEAAVIEFLDGPARGQFLDLRRAPVVLRVVRSSRGKFDALDQPGDVATADETIFPYLLACTPTQMHIYAAKSAGGSRWVACGVYELLAPLGVEPTDSTMRDNARWFDWCEANKPELLDRHRAAVAARKSRLHAPRGLFD
jgi:hypothetical protein